MVYNINMKKFIKYLLLSPMMFSVIGCGNQTKSEEKSMEPKPVDVVVISGQSNAVGCTHAKCITRSIGAEAYSTYMTGYNDIKIAYDSTDKKFHLFENFS